MSLNNRAKKGVKNERLLKRVNARWVFACEPRSGKWRLFMKVPGTRQTYEAATSPFEVYQMIHLVEYAAENGEMAPVLSPNFIRSGKA